MRGRCAWDVHTQPHPPGTVAVHSLHAGLRLLGAPLLRGAPLGLREGPRVSTCHTCCALSPHDLDTDNRTFPTRHFTCSHLLSSLRRPPVVADIRLLPVDAESTLALGTPFQQPHTHSCPSRLFLTVPGPPPQKEHPASLDSLRSFPGT